MSEHQHHIVSVKSCTIVAATLLFFTWITVAASQIDIGIFNFPLAMLIASIKASLVVFIFMGLSHDSNENRVIFFSSLIFVAIFIFFVFSDLLFRNPSNYVNDAPEIMIQDIEK